MAANNHQVAGDHYNQKEYQHWDFVIDTHLHYITANATKYVSRWQNKNGLEDLKKSLHYLDKAIERHVSATTVSIHTPHGQKCISTFVEQFPKEEATIIVKICYGDYKTAKSLIQDLIEETEFQEEISLARSRDGV